MRIIAFLRQTAARFDTWFAVSGPVAYRDAWRYSALFAVILFPQAVTQFVLGNAVWPVLLALIVPAMAAFTFGFAVRAGTARQRGLSLGVGLLVAASAAVPPVRAAVVAVGAPGILLLWLLVLGLLGYAFPEYGPAVTDPHRDGDSPG